MIRAEVIAYAGVPDGFRAWSIVDDISVLVLDGDLSHDRTGRLVANIAWLAVPHRASIVTRLRRGRPPALESLTDPRAVVDRILDAEDLSVQGGVRLVDDATGTVLDPGCCVQVYDWADWADLLRGEPVVVGHDPELVVDVRGDTCVAWSVEGGDTPDGPPPHVPRIAFPTTAVPEHISVMRRSLTATTDRVGEWASALVPGQADDLVTRIREAWGVAEQPGGVPRVS